MLALMWVSAIVAATVHVAIFCMESLWWHRPAVRKRFRQTDAQAEASRLFALNQGFYNLFLAIGVAVGLALMAAGHSAGMILAGWNCLFMVGAAVVLAVSAPGMGRAALIQGGAPALFLLAAAIRGAI